VISTGRFFALKSPRKVVAGDIAMTTLALSPLKHLAGRPIAVFLRTLGFAFFNKSIITSFKDDIPLNKN
jgi:hypothetical protein